MGYSLGALGGAAEVGIMAVGEEATDYSGMIFGYSALLMLLLSIAAGFYFIVRKACKGITDWLNPFGGRGVLTLAYGIFFVGYMVVVMKPADCTQGIVDFEVPDDERECPFSDDFNHNAIFHTIWMLGVVVELLGVLLALRAIEAKVGD